MNALYYSITGQEMGSGNKATASRNGISNFLLCFVFEMDATFRPLPKKTRNTNDSWLVEILLQDADRIDPCIVQA
jgi:hypothetical protein